MAVDDWKRVMDAAEEMGRIRGLTWFQVKDAAYRRYTAECPLPEGEGVTSSDMNHMVYSVYKSGELASALNDVLRERISV